MLPSTALPYSTGHGKPSVFNLGFPGLPDLQRLGSSTGLPTPRTPTTPTAGAPNRAAARQAKQAGPDLSAVALSSPLGSTPRGRGVARVMGSPPQACASAKGRTNRHSWKLRATALAPSRRATASWEGSGSPEGGGAWLLREPGGSCVDHAWPLCPGLCHWCSGRIGLNYLQCAYRLRLSLSGRVGWGGPCKLAKGTTEYGRKEYLLNLEGDSQNAPRSSRCLAQGVAGGRQGGVLSGGLPAPRRSWR